MPKDGTRNLIPLSKRSKEEQDEIRRKAAAAKKAKAEARRELREIMSEESNELVQNKTTGEFITKRRLITKKVVEGAMSGEPNKVKLWAELSGEVKHRVEVTGNEGKDLIPDDVDKIMEELNALRRMTEGISGASN